jgi:hypothetical protein
MAFASGKDADLSDLLNVPRQYKTPYHYDANKRRDPIMDVESKDRRVRSQKFKKCIHSAKLYSLQPIKIS